MIELIEGANLFSGRIAIVSGGVNYDYATLLEVSRQWAIWLLDGKEDLKEERIAFMVKPSFSYVALQWAIWRAGGISVPISPESPLPVVQYALENTGAFRLITDQQLPEGWPHYAIVPSPDKIAFADSIPLPDIDLSRRAQILFTSGTTNKPKGVVHTFAQLNFQVEALVNAWCWSENDYILNVLPLHHVHGIVNVVCCALWSGATVEFISGFDPATVWDKMTSGRVNVFMAVPTVYHKLITCYNQSSANLQNHWSERLRSFRLMVSGSAALPVATLEIWEKISGHRLLERYGMTEIGMAISNPYFGERKAGRVGQPLPGVQVRLNSMEGEPGEIQVKSPGVFLEYWKNPEATAKSFTEDGWFKTGDIGSLEDGYYQILGRDNIDIIKSGGYKISALEIEDVLLRMEGIHECAVIGLHDEEWGEIITALVVANPKTITEAVIKAWCRDQIAPYKCPRKIIFLTKLPRNAMGKIVKSELREMVRNI